MALDLNKINLESLSGSPQESPIIADQKTPLQATLSEAIKVNPDSQVKLQKLSQESGLPDFAIQGAEAEVETSLKLNQIDLDSMVKRSPGTAKYLTDWQNASIAHDDIDVLEELEGLFRFGRTFENIGETTAIGFEEQATGILLRGADKSADRIVDLVPPSMLPLGIADYSYQLSYDVANRMGVQTDEELQQLKEEAKNELVGQLQELQQRRQALTPDDLNTLEQGVRAGIESLMNMAPGAALTVLTGGRAAPLLTTIGVQTFGQSYGTARAEGEDPQTASWYAGIDAAIEVGTEILPTGTLTRILTGGAQGKMTKEALKFTVQEMGTEQLATLGQSLNAYAFGLDEELEKAETIEEMVDIQLQRQAVTAIATVVAGGAQIAAASTVRKGIEALNRETEQQVNQGEAEQVRIDGINDAANRSKLKQRDPESFRQFLQEADGDQNSSVYIDGVQASLYLQGKSRKEIESDPALVKLQEQAREAASLGGDVVIPVPDFAADIAGTEHFDALREHMTLSAETVTPFRQEQVRDQTQNYVQSLVEEAEQNASEYVESQQIYESVREQLIDTGMVSAQNAGVMAQVVPAWATVYARKNGITVQEAYQRSGLTITGPQTGRMEEVTGEQVLTQAGEPTRDFRTRIREEYPELKIDLTGTGDVATLDRIVVPEEQRQTGIGSDVMQRIVEWADRNNKRVALTPSADFGGNKKRLTEFYKRFGFVENKGRNKDYEISETMYRDPQLAQPAQTGPEQARGYYNPANSMIRLTEAADLSTFLHEFAHFMYEMELATGSDTVQSIHNWFKRNAEAVAVEAGEYADEDAGTLNGVDVLNYLDTGSTGSPQKDMAIRRAVHEQFARGFETYLMEGKAPSIELRNAFRTFARWLTQIYQRIRGDLKVDLDNEMRQVFDRMLATEEQIQMAEARAKYAPLFTDAAMAGMTAEEWSDYQQRQQKVKDKQTETLREKLISELTRQTKKWWKEEKRDIYTEERQRLQTERVYVARDRLKTGDIKLDRATVKEMVGEEFTDTRGRTFTRVPPALSGMHLPGSQGIHPDEAAGMLGYSSGAEMLDDMLRAPRLNEAADTRAEEIMKERHGDILNDGTIEQQADEAVQSEERGRFLLHELKILSRGTTASTFDRQAIKQLAEDRIAKLSFREINPGKYRKAEIKAAQEAARMLAENNREGAAQAKQRQVANYYLGMAATDARNNVTKIVDRMARYNKKSVREEIQKAGNEYWEQLQKILERFELRKGATLRQVEQLNTDINTWMRERTEQDGDALILAPTVLNESYVTHWKNVPYGELQGISDSVRNIEHVARYSNKITRLQEEMDFKTLVDRWVTSMDEKVKTAFKPQRTDVVEGRKWGQWAMAQMTKVPYLASWLDGGERAGMSHQILVQPFTDAYDAEVRTWAEVGNPVLEAIQNRDKETVKRHNRKIFIPEIKDENNDGNLFGHQIIAVALNTGNQSNLKKMLLGEGWANPEIESELSFDNRKLQAVLKHMTRSDWDMVQMIWDRMEMLYPQLADVHRRTTGLTPPKVEATPIRIEVDGETLNLRGGYYPVKYDPNRSQRAQENEDKLNAETESMFSNSSSIQASVTAGATNERTGYYAPIRLSLDVVPAHFQETIHFITHHDAVREVNKLLRNKTVASKISEKMGKEEFSQLRPWLNDIAKDGREAPAKMFWDSILQRLRFGVTLGAMGFKASTGVMQLFGLSNTVAEVGIAPVMQSVRSILGGTTTMRQAWEFARSNSKVLDHRATTMDREIKNAMQQIEGKRGILAAVQEASMKHIALIQTYMVDLPSWQAAYIKAMKEHGDETRAYQYADWVIENIQGSGVTKDMARIMRGQTETGRMFTMFMTFFSSLWNMERDLVRGARSGIYSRTTVAAKLAFIFFIPVYVEMLMRGEFGGDEDDDESKLQTYLTKTALYSVASVPFVRDIASAVGGDFGYNITPMQQILEQGTRAIPELIQRPFTDEEITKGQVKGATKFIGAATGVPGTGQAWATGEHLYEVLADGEDLTMRELLFGPDRD